MSDDPNEPVEPEVTRPNRKVGRKPAQVVVVDDVVIAKEPATIDPREDKFGERLAALLFGLVIVGVIAFCVAFVTIDPKAHLGRTMNFAIGGAFTLSLLGLGAGLIVWAKQLLPHEKAIQERHEFHSPEEEELEAEEIFLQGAQDMQLGSRKLLRRTLLGAAALLPLPAVLMLRDLGPLPGSALRHTGWKAGDRLVDVETRLPIKLGDIEIGGIATVMPEGFETVEKLDLAPTILIRFGPGEIRSKKETAWGIDNHVAYSKICSHAGCPISLYEQQTHHLLCPCHQSTFDMANDANVIFGPAARRLPQLQIQVDAEG
ncbi:MAG: ubiquinol-cytochrome c reductase iron-sulfur subunit, partial [Frankiaceae bacterium]|nr:ubiquinol-cytochrome c reductase iron-sulfur subunit [Frankiaceae bacterium]